MVLGAFASSAFGGPIAKVLGRKGSIWLASLMCVVANVVMMATTSIGALYFARLLIGLANGLYMTFAQLYLNECAPARYRGLVIGLFQTWTSIGTLVGTIVDNFTVKLGGRESYLVPLGIIYIIPAVLSVGLLFIPESPRWYILQNKTDKARKALTWLRPYPDLIDGEIQEISAAIEAERALANSADMLDMFRNPVDRRRTLLSIGAIGLQAASGAMYMISYGTYFFEMAKVGSAFENSCILVAVGVIAILINSAIITRWGRRRVFLTVGMCLCGLTQLIVAVVYDKQGPGTSTGKVSRDPNYNLTREVSNVESGHRRRFRRLHHRLQRHGRDLRMALRCRVPFSTTTKLHLRLGHLNWIPRSVACHVHSSILH